MRAGLLVLLILLAGIAAPAQPINKPAEQYSWTDATRDVYCAGRLDKTIQAFSLDSPKRLALVSPDLAQVILLDLEGNLAGTLPRAALRISDDRTSAVSDPGSQMDVVGMITVPEESHYSFDFGGKSYLITPHKGLVGALTEEALWVDVPIWRTLMNKYRPDSAAVAGLTQSAPATVVIAVGTWCGDSKRLVPQLLRALHDAGNPRLQVKLVGIANKFVEPAQFVSGHNIKKVPTVIVEREGKEIDRIIETPKAQTMEEDLLNILNRKPDTPKAN
jgi:hypothetical protein